MCREQCNITAAFPVVRQQKRDWLHHWTTRAVELANRQYGSPRRTTSYRGLKTGLQIWETILEGLDQQDVRTRPNPNKRSPRCVLLGPTNPVAHFGSSIVGARGGFG